MPKEGDQECHALDIVTLQNDNANLKKLVDASKLQVDELTKKLADSEKAAKDAVDELTKYKDAEKKALLDSIPSKSEFKADELKDRPLEELRTIALTIDKVPTGIVKNVRAAGANLPSRANIMADGRIDQSKSLMPHPELQTDGSIKWVK